MVGMAASEILIVMVFLMGGQMGLPLGLPPGPEDPLMSRFAPRIACSIPAGRRP